MKGLLMLTYAPLFAGFANKIHNEFKAKGEKDVRKMKLDFLFDKKTYINSFKSGQDGEKSRENLFNIVKFTAQDQVNAFKTGVSAVKDTFKQGIDYIMRKRKDVPDIFTLQPTKESMSLATSSIVVGALAKVLFAGKLGKWGKRTADFFIGAGLIFDSLGMMTLAKANDDSRKLPMLVGGPMRIIGDFGHENNYLFGLRTLGGAAFEYYYALVNKEKDGKLE
jgi:hypothetical protein